jgi:hypothetical protein
MRRATIVLCSCLLAGALACGSDSPAPPPVTGATCDGGSSVAFKTCTPPGSPRFVDGHTVNAVDPKGVCNKPIQPSTPGGFAAQAMGVKAVGSQVTFNVPACTGSISIISQAQTAQTTPVTITTGGTPFPIDNSAAPTSVKDASGRTLLDTPYSGSATPENSLVYYASLSPWEGAMTFPDSSALLNEVSTNGQLPPGTWSFQVDDLANDCARFSNCADGGSGGTYDVTVITKPVAPSTGTVDVGFYLVDNGGLTSTTAAAQAGTPTTALGRMIQTLETIYARAGLCLGTVTFYDVPAWARNAYATTISADKTGPCDNLNQMFLLSQPGNTLNFFLVSSISSSSQGGNTVVGIDGTIPGPSSVGGTIHSGAAVSIASLSTNFTSCGSSLNFTGCGADEVAYITAHEGGHWLGLYHTTEALGDTFDPLSDTAQCPCASCKPSTATQTCGTDPAKSYQMSVAACTKSASCGGGDDLMFWLISGGSVGNLTAEQGQVMRGNPVVQ